VLRATRRGITLVEVIAAVLIVAVLAAATYPTIAAQWRRGQSTALGDQLSNLRSAILAYRENVQRYPRTLLQLTNALAASATDACAATMTAPIRSNWRGPYMSSNPTGEIKVGDFTVKDTLVRVPTTDAGTAAGILQLRVIEVDQVSATDVERQFDGGNPVDFTAGNVLWTSNGVDTLKLQILIRNC
jgi:prepilin-type N-terminal cleavage/methylation domain-containing protein